jgi:membrane protease YdiL (CAAX protease family)
MKRTEPASFFFSSWSKIWPVLLVAILLFLALLVDALFSSFGGRFFTRSQIQSSPWMLYYVGHTGMLVAALVLIYIMSGGHPQKFGLRLPLAKSYVSAALGWGIVFAIVMTIIDYLPNLLRHTAPNFTLSTHNVLGWLSFEGLFAGTVEEILFRGLLVSYLASKISGRVRLGSFNLHAAGVIVAFLFCLAHVGSFYGRPFWIAMGQQAYAFVWAIFYAYWLEKSGSVLAPIIGHNVGNFIEYCFVFLMVYGWR